MSTSTKSALLFEVTASLLYNSVQSLPSFETEILNHTSPLPLRAASTPIFATKRV